MHEASKCTHCIIYVCVSVLNSGIVRYIHNVVFGTDESDLFIEVSLIQGLLGTQMWHLGQMKVTYL